MISLPSLLLLSGILAFLTLPCLILLVSVSVFVYVRADGTTNIRQNQKVKQLHSYLRCLPTCLGTP